jgi:hypothetical protein
VSEVGKPEVELVKRGYRRMQNPPFRATHVSNSRQRLNHAPGKEARPDDLIEGQSYKEGL